MVAARTHRVLPLTCIIMGAVPTIASARQPRFQAAGFVVSSGVSRSSMMLPNPLVGGYSTRSYHSKNIRNAGGKFDSSALYGSIGDGAENNDDATNEFEPRFLLDRMETASPTAKKEAIIVDDQQSIINNEDEQTTQQQQQQQSADNNTIQRRQFLVATTLLAAQLTASFASADAASALDPKTLPVLTERMNYQQSPINKRSGITLSEPERIYPLSFITYLSRFLLVFDDECQRWWYNQAQAIPPKSSKADVEDLRLRQFGQFAASVEVGLIDFEATDADGATGPTRLIDSLVRRYGPGSSGKGEGAGADERDVRRSKEALRQLALLFSLLNEDQPVECITQILAADDDATIDNIMVMDGGAGYPPPAYLAPDVKFPDPPTMGTDFGGVVAKGSAVMKESGRVWKVETTQGGRGYLNPPKVEISFPSSSSLSGSDNKGKDAAAVNNEGRVGATAQAIMGKKKSKGSVERIEILDAGAGYDSLADVLVTVSPPESSDGVAATAKAILEYEVIGIELADQGRGYAAEKPINIVIDPPPGAARGERGSRSAFAVAYPKGKSTSYESFIGGGNDAVSASSSNVDTSQWIAGPTSAELLGLLPSGFGLQYDIALERYILSRSSSSNNWDDILGGSLEGQTFKAINPIFGFRGRSPIEREKNFDPSKVARFMASGAVCSSIAHFALTPIDVVKTKVQTKPDVYNTGIIGTFQKVLKEEGPKTFFDGWEPTFVGYFFGGAVAFFFTEFFRRQYSILVMNGMMASSAVSEVSASTMMASWEIPIIVAGAASSAFFCCFVLAPFDALRIRTVSQPDYADNIFGVTSRMVNEEGLLSLFSTVPVWFVKEIPFNIMKFLVFDTSTDYMYEAYPAAREDIRLSLLVSLIGGTLGGIAASIVSNPADVLVSELKKSKTEMSPFEAVDIIKERAGLLGFTKGLSLRMIYYSLLVSLQFFLYDVVRISLGVGTDDMKLYLNVLNVALNERAKQ